MSHVRENIMPRGQRKKALLVRNALVLCCLLVSFRLEEALGQVIANNGAVMSISSGTVVIAADVENSSGTLSNGGTITLTGSYTNSATTNGNGTYNVAGDWVNAGTFTPGTSTVGYNGSSAQSVAGMSYYNLTVSNTGTKTAAGNLSVSGMLTLDTDFSVGSNTLTMGSSSITIGAGDVTGNVARNSFVTATSYTFGNQFTTITFASGTLPTSLTVNIEKGSTPSGKADAILRSYSITQSGGSGFSATLRLHYLDSELNGNTSTDLALWKNPGTWTDMGRTGSVNTTNKYSELSGVTSFSTWTLANASLSVFTVSFTSPQTNGVAFTGTNAITAKDQNGNTLTSFDASGNNVTISSSPSDGTITGLGSGNNNILNQAGDFTNGVANVTSLMKFTGQPGGHTFTATSTTGKTGTSGTVVINANTTTWLHSAVSSDWNNPANWSNGVPDSTKSVVIGDSTRVPTVPTFNADCFDLTVNSGGVLRWDSCGGTLYIHGNIVTTNGGTIDLGHCAPPNQIVFLNNATFNNGGTVNAGNGVIDLNGSTWTNNSGSTFDPGTSTVLISGEGSQAISGDISFYNLTVTNTTSTVTFSGNVTVENDMTAAPGSDVQVGGGGSLTVEGTLTGDISSSSRPFMTNAAAPSTTQVDVTFNTSVDATTSQTSSNYSINSGSISVTGATRDASNHAHVHLTVSTLTAGVEDTLTVNNVQDTLGNTIAANSKKRFTLQAGRKYYSRTSGNWNSASTWSTISHVGTAASSAPGSTPGDTVEIANGNTITLDVNASNLALVVVGSSGTLNTGSYVVSGTGTFTLNTNGTLVIGSTDGISSSGSTGSIQTTTRTFSTSANYRYEGSGAQSTGSGLPGTVKTLTIAKSGSSVLSLTDSVYVSSNLVVSSGVFDILAKRANHVLPAADTLRIDSGATLRVGGSSGGMIGSNFPANFSSYVLTGTVEFNGTGAQSIPALTFTYLSTSGGSKTFSGSASIPGDLLVASGAFTIDADITVGGNVLVSSGATLTVNVARVLIVSGFVDNQGTVFNNGTIR